MRKFASNVVRAVREVTLPVWVLSRKGAAHVPLSGREDGIVVSLTSFPARMDGLWIVIDSLFRQTLKPDKIVLALTEEEFPGGIGDLPASILRFMEYGLEIAFLPYNMRCHNKYTYAFETFREAVVVTVDDDSVYPPDTVERLVALSGKYPGAVCCNIAAVIDPLHFHEYSFWRKSSGEREPSNENVALGFAGVLYPRGLDKGAFLDRDLAMSLSPTADDLWLKAVEMAVGVKVACGGFFPRPVTIKSSQKVSLRKVNKGTTNRNDAQWKALDEYFNLKERL